MRSRKKRASSIVSLPPGTCPRPSPSLVARVFPLRTSHSALRFAFDLRSHSNVLPSRARVLPRWRPWRDSRLRARIFPSVVVCLTVRSVPFRSLILTQRTPKWMGPCGQATRSWRSGGKVRRGQTTLGLIAFGWSDGREGSNTSKLAALEARYITIPMVGCAEEGVLRPCQATA